VSRITPPQNVQTLIAGGLVAGYLYAVVLSASAIAVCETKRTGNCAEAWNQGYSTATGLVTTFLAYLIPPGAPVTTRTRKEDSNASP